MLDYGAPDHRLQALLKTLCGQGAIRLGDQLALDRGAPVVRVNALMYMQRLDHRRGEHPQGRDEKAARAHRRVADLEGE